MGPFVIARLLTALSSAKCYSELDMVCREYMEAMERLVWVIEWEFGLSLHQQPTLSTPKRS